MKKTISFLMIGLLCACSNGGGGGGSYVPPSDNQTEPEPPQIEESLTDSEMLFGKGEGVGEVPTNIIRRQDGAGFSYMSFGGWGNVYDVIRTTKQYSVGGYRPSMSDTQTRLEFTSQQVTLTDSWNKGVDSSIADTTFRGPVIMYRAGFLPFTTEGNLRNHIKGEDYGTAELKIGHDISNMRIKFVMRDSENNRDVSLPSSQCKFSDDFDNVKFHYVESWTEEYLLNGTDHYNEREYRIYHGYGTKQ